MDRITSISVKNVRNISNLTCKLVFPTTLVVGDAGSGKTTLVDCFQMLKEVGRGKGLSDVKVPGELRMKGASSWEISVEVVDHSQQKPPLLYTLEGDHDLLQETLACRLPHEGSWRVVETKEGVRATSSLLRMYEVLDSILVVGVDSELDLARKWMQLREEDPDGFQNAFCSSASAAFSAAAWMESFSIFVRESKRALCRFFVFWAEIFVHSSMGSGIRKEELFASSVGRRREALGQSGNGGIEHFGVE